ncbi:fatty acid-binding protein, liver-like [Glandiceps talaboti]
MADIVGSWKLESQDGIDDLAKFLELSEEKTQYFKAMKPTMDITKTGNTILFKVKYSEELPVKEHKILLGQEFEVLNEATGEQIKSAATLEGNKLVVKPVVETPKSIFSSDEVIDGKFVVTMTTKTGVTCKQYFVRV